MLTTLTFALTMFGLSFTEPFILLVFGAFLITLSGFARRWAKQHATKSPENVHETLRGQSVEPINLNLKSQISDFKFKY